MEERNFQTVREFSFDVQRAVVRTLIDREGEPWFVANDVCSILEISNPRHAVSRLDDDEKGVALTDTLGGAQEVNIVNESGLYSLIFRSDKPQAKLFRKWVTGEVLPAIRKHGMYGKLVNMDVPDDLDQACALWTYLRSQRAFHINMTKQLRALESSCIERISRVAPPLRIAAEAQMPLPMMAALEG